MGTEQVSGKFGKDIFIQNMNGIGCLSDQGQAGRSFYFRQKRNSSFPETQNPEIRDIIMAFSDSQILLGDGKENVDETSAYPGIGILPGL